MESKHASERELGRCIDSMVDEMNGIYCADLTDEARIDAKMRDIKLREELISQIREEIRCKKISERIMAEQMKEVNYRIEVDISAEDTGFRVARSDVRSRMQSE